LRQTHKFLFLRLDLRLEKPLRGNNFLVATFKIVNLA